MTANVKQQQAIDAIKAGRNVFITGPGGVGKSWVVDQIQDSKTVLAAPTGIAAINIKGTTCHKLFNLPIGIPQHKDGFINSSFKNLFGIDKEGNAGITRIIIDEIGMVRADMFDLIDTKLRKARSSDKPFGGIQMVVVGDFFQLEPIVSSPEKDHYYENYNSPFAFTAKAWDFETIELTDVVRQCNDRQVALLNSVRKKQAHYKDALHLIQKESLPYTAGQDILHLCCFNKGVEDVNEYWYKQIEESEQVYYASVNGVFKHNEMPVKDVLPLKKRAKVLITANSPLGYYCNGDRGTVESLMDNGVYVRLDSGNLVFVQAFEWEKIEYKKHNGMLLKNTVATFQQIPIKLGYALSIHKSQGATLDSAAIDVGRGCFGHGQLYVALSRVKNLQNLSFVRDVSHRNVIVRDDVREFYETV